MVKWLYCLIVNCVLLLMCDALSGSNPHNACDRKTSVFIIWLISLMQSLLLLLKFAGYTQENDTANCRHSGNLMNF